LESAGEKCVDELAHDDDDDDDESCQWVVRFGV